MRRRSTAGSSPLPTVLLAMLVLVAAALAGHRGGSAAANPGRDPLAFGQIIVRPAAGAERALDALHLRLGARVVRRIPVLGALVVRLDDEAADSPGGADRSRLEAALHAYAASGLVVRLALDAPVRLVAPRADPSAWQGNVIGWQGQPGNAWSPDLGPTLGLARPPESPGAAPAAAPRAVLARPNDPRLGDQWLVDTIGLPAAWDLVRGDGVTIAIVDTGVDCDHEDLAGRCVAGYDVVNRDDDPDDDNGHGTIEAGIAAAATDNGVGIAGVGWGARIMPVKAMNALGQGTLSGIAEAMVWATDNGARVINLSLGGPIAEAVLEDAVAYAHDRGVVVVAASGNMGAAGVFYPAAYARAIGVGATTRADTKATFSNWGPALDLVAPGWQILTTDLNDAYGVYDGTSEATAVVSGLAALLIAQRPSRSPDDVAGILARTAVDLGAPGRDDFFGHGRVDAAAAVAAQPAPPTPAPTATRPAMCRPYHIDFVAFPDTVGVGGFGCMGCDRVIGGGDKWSAAQCGLTPLRVTVTTAGGAVVADQVLAPGRDGAIRVRLSLCDAPPFRVTLADDASGCYVLCPTTPAEVLLGAARFGGFGRSAEVVWSFGHCVR